MLLKGDIMAPFLFPAHYRQRLGIPWHGFKTLWLSGIACAGDSLDRTFFKPKYDKEIARLNVATRRDR